MNSAGRRHYPSYHTVVDNFDYMERFVDPSLSAHVSLSQLAADVVLQMSSSARLPLDVRELADTLEMEYDSLQQDGMDLFNNLLGIYSTHFICLFVITSANHGKCFLLVGLLCRRPHRGGGIINCPRLSVCLWCAST